MVRAGGIIGSSGAHSASPRSLGYPAVLKDFRDVIERLVCALL
jgi:hypothetical protein